MVILRVISLSTKSSFTPVTVRVWGVFQLVVVKVREFVDIVPSVLSTFAKLMVMLDVG